MLTYLIIKKDIVRHYVAKYYYKYGLFCSTHPILMILFSCSVIITCSLPLTSFPIFEKIIAFLFQRIQVKYDTKVSLANDNSTHNEVLAYIQQMNFNVTLSSTTDLSRQEILQNIMQFSHFKKLEHQLRYPSGIWNETCLKLQRDPPSMKALKKRIKFPRGSIHEDLKMRTFYSLQCLFVGPLFLFDDGSGVVANELSTQFKELTVGYPINTDEFDQSEKEVKHVSFVFTFFQRNINTRFQDSLLDGFKQMDGFMHVTTRNETGIRINYQFSEESAPAELIPLTIAYIVVFFYLWFSVAKLDLIRTRWGLACSAVLNCCFSFTMAIGICAMFDVLPSTLNVGEIFPYVVILIGIENFWIITKSVMTTKKELEVKERVAIGLGMEGWYITKNLVIEFSLLFVGYMSGIKGIQELSIFALACYLSDFFLQMTFFTPILAVDTRRAEVGLPFTDSSAWRYAFCIEIERPETCIKSSSTTPSFSYAVKVAFNIARYRIIQRSVMVLMVVYFASVFVTLPLHEIVNPVPSKFPITPNSTNQNLTCLNAYDSHRKSQLSSWELLCGKHWPELFNYYFIHLNQRTLVTLPQIDVSFTLDPSTLQKVKSLPSEHNVFEKIIGVASGMSKPVFTMCFIVILSIMYKLGTIIQSYISQMRSEADIYMCESGKLTVPSPRKFKYKVSKMVVDETDTLICAFNNGAVYIWDLFYSSCNYHVDRKTKRVHCYGIAKSPSTASLPGDGTDPYLYGSCNELPLAVWCLGYKSEVLIVGCEAGIVEVYSLEKDNESLQCEYESENLTGIVSVKVISCLRFVIAHKNGVVEFCHLKGRQSGHKRSSSLPDPVQSTREISVSRVVNLFQQGILHMDIAVDKLYVTSSCGQVKVLRASDDGGIPLQSNMPREQEISIIKTELSPEMALVGTANGYVHVLDVYGQVVKSLYCGEDEVMSIASDDDYIAVLAYDGVLTVWLKEGFIKWWQVNLVTYGGAYEILSLARYSLAAVSKEFVILMNIFTRSIISVVSYDVSPVAGLIMALPLVCQNKCSMVVSCGNSVAHLKFPKLVDHNR